MIKQEFWAYIVLAFPIILMSIFLIYPVGTVIIYGLFSGSGSSFIETISAYYTQFTLAFTLAQASISTILALLIGLPGAILLARLRFRGKSLIRALIIVPFVLPPIVVVVGFLQMFGSFGIIDSILMQVTQSTASILNLADGFVGIVLAHTFYNAPLVILLVSASMERLNPEIEESAEILGADSFARFRRITLPHILPALAASAILTFLFCFMSFPIVLAFGNGVYRTLEVQIWNAFRWSDYGEASSLALIQILITITLAISYIKLGRINENESGPTTTIKTTTLGKYKPLEKAAIVTYLIAILFLIGGPIISIIRAAVFDPIRQIYTLDGFSYLTRIGSNGGFEPLINSLFYGGLATMLSIIIGIPLAYTHRSKTRGLPSLSSIMILLPLGISSITVAYGLMTVIAVPTGLNINPWPIIVIAQTIIGIPFTARSIEIGLKSIDPNILDQADSLGATRIQRLFFVELPLLIPSILVGAIFAFAMAIGEMSATLFIALPQNYTLAVAIYDNLGVRHFVEAGACSLILVALCVVSFLAMEKISEGSTGGTL
ncbi:MAG: iron ABC transporter permease [Candidatus Thorarchaeota archaeon]|nr:MAG: iron ABC transporter permease [Candidatus Thorarchaeota archaeon]